MICKILTVFVKTYLNHLYFRYNSCPFYYNYYDYAEYAVLLVITCNLIYFGGRLLVLSLDKLQIPITLEQKQLLGINDSGV